MNLTKSNTIWGNRLCKKELKLRSPQMLHGCCGNSNDAWSQANETTELAREPSVLKQREMTTEKCPFSKIYYSIILIVLFRSWPQDGGQTSLSRPCSLSSFLVSLNAFREREIDN